MFNQYRDFDAKNIFKTFNGHLAYDGRLNGLDIFIMQSEENTKKVIDGAKSLIYMYNTDKTSAINVALRRYNLSLIKDFTDNDRQRILDWVENSGLIF